MMHPAMLDIAATALVVVDVQEAFRKAIPDFALVASRAAMAVRGFYILGVPIIVTEQYPAGLGPTAEEIRLSLPDEFQTLEKTSFSSCGASGFISTLEEHSIKQVVLSGLETHVCVSQTAHELVERGFQAHVLVDCVCSRFEYDKQAGLAKMAASGVIMSSIEMAFFEMMRDSRHGSFKDIQNLIR
ncbi:MAG TPA: isochorismatase family protein [Pyrinomonadaceae bacterium]|nr:isochorismatase family protein [Pyrinomonadaceae bacterium]